MKGAPLRNRRSQSKSQNVSIHSQRSSRRQTRPWFEERPTASSHLTFRSPTISISTIVELLSKLPVVNDEVDREVHSKLRTLRALPLRFSWMANRETTWYHARNLKPTVDNIIIRTARVILLTPSHHTVGFIILRFTNRLKAHNSPSSQSPCLRHPHNHHTHLQARHVPLPRDSRHRPTSQRLFTHVMVHIIALFILAIIGVRLLVHLHKVRRQVSAQIF